MPLPAEFGPWQTAWKRHRLFSSDGTWDRIHAELLRAADGAGEIAWAVSVVRWTMRLGRKGDCGTSPRLV
jgi:transposase